MIIYILIFFPHITLTDYNMNVLIYDQFSELVEAKSFHTGQLETMYKSLSSYEKVLAYNLTKEEAYKYVEKVKEETKKMGLSYEFIFDQPGYAEIKVDLESLKGTENLYRVIFIK